MTPAPPRRPLKVLLASPITLIALLTNGEAQANAVIKGVDENYIYVAGVADHIVRGAFELGTADEPLLVLGAGVENAVGVQSDRSLEPLLLYTGKKGSVDMQNPLNSVSSGQVYASGAFIIQQEFDNKYVLTNLPFVQQMLGLPPDTYTAAEIAIVQDGDEEEVQQGITAVLDKSYLVQTRYQQNRSLYSVMQSEKWVIYAILSLILVVAAFNMIGALTMLVLEKKGDITTLHALGGSRPFIQNIFFSLFQLPVLQRVH